MKAISVHKQVFNRVNLSSNFLLLLAGSEFGDAGGLACYRKTLSLCSFVITLVIESVNGPV